MDHLADYIRNLNPTVTVSVATGIQNRVAADDPYRADGGLIRGPGGPRDDKAGWYALSNREYVQSAAAVDYYGVGYMEALNHRMIPRGRMADGGTPGGGNNSQPLLTLSRLMHLLARPEDVTTLKEVNNLIQVRNREEHQLSEALREQAKARELVKDLAHDKTASDKEQAAAAKKLEQAEKAVTDQRSELADATDKQREAQAALVEQAKTFALTVSSLGDAFGGEGTSLSAQGLLAKKLAAGDAGKEFNTYLKVLRRKNLDDDLIAELRAQGPTSEGLALAKDLAESGRRQIRTLNRADDRLDRVARDVGTFGTAGRGGHGGGIGTQINNNFNGPISGDPHKIAREAEKKQRKALAIARLG